MIHSLIMRLKQVSLPAALVLLTACGTFQVEVEPGVTIQPTVVVQTIGETPTADVDVEPTATATSIPEQAEPAPTRTPLPEVDAVTDEPTDTAAEESSQLWVVYRSPEYGYGMALPCYWVIDAAHGLSTRSYDEMFAMSNTVRSAWKDGSPPDGAFNPDIGVFEYGDSGIAPGTPMEEAVPLLIGDEIASTERIRVGSNEALVAYLNGEGAPDYFANQLYFFQLSPERVLMFAPKWTNALESPDVQAILVSLALTAEDEVVIPSNDPVGRVEGRSVYMSQEMGACFQYPSDFALAEIAPSQPMSAGPLVTLKLERLLYTVGMTIEAQQVASNLTLEEAVSRFTDQFGAEAGSSIRRNPPELVAGAFYHLGGEAAELLDEVPGAERSRDVFAIHEGRLYHLTIKPSFLTDPGAADDVNTLYEVVRTSFSYLPVE